MIDSHCHLDYDPLYNNLDDVLKRSKDVGIEKLLTICTTFESFDKIKELVKKDDIIYGTYGIHHHEAKNNKVTTPLIIEEINVNKKIIGIGETGLDFYYNFSDKKDQIESFKKHIEASIELSIPLIIHCRNAEAQILEIFNQYKKYDLKILMHCFTGSKEFAEKLFDFNAYFSASGIITFKNSTDLQKTFKSIPIERTLIETDSPYLAPVPNRGKKNEPSFVKEISLSDLIRNTTFNFNKLFS